VFKQRLNQLFSDCRLAVCWCFTHYSTHCEL